MSGQQVTPEDLKLYTVFAKILGNPEHMRVSPVESLVKDCGAAVTRGDMTIDEMVGVVSTSFAAAREGCGNSLRDIAEAMRASIFPETQKELAGVTLDTEEQFYDVRDRYVGEGRLQKALNLDLGAGG